ncbi:hypothetical protein DSL72_004473 [Monilinia vaccinii-corymbosi]|uniref:Uncharacterized protein n=1 Tax=Monilinia vaccinii-corymbosi TaxID=61207 RepID=A0A8A3NW68_9HELO|nr:hypothetical protein DSL72_004473 [Monilinia vaccinii-corymbosi]
MLPRPSTSCRRLKHNLTTSFEYVWISELDIYNAFQRFCGIPKIIRRHGSSVPGPMESRRRLGRRRMAHVTEMTQVPMYDPGVVWCSSWGPEKIKSQWKAPTPRITEQPKHPPSLPSWLTSWNPIPGQLLDYSTEATGSEELIEKGYDVLYQERRINDHFDDFETAIKAHRRECSAMITHRRIGERKKCRNKHVYRPNKALELSISFGEKLEQSLTLGLVTSDLLSSTLQAVTDVIVEFSSGCCSITEDSAQKNLGIRGHPCGNGVDVTKQLLAFYTRIWRGIVSCKILKPADFESKVMGEYLSLLARLPSTREIQLLISEILPSLSASQLDSNVNALLSLCNKWSLSWLEKKLKTSTNSDKALIKAEESLKVPQHSINRLLMFVWFNRGKETPEMIQRIRDVLVRISTDLSAATSQVWAAEGILIPHSHSIQTMSTTLANLPRGLVSTLVRAHSEFISSSSFLGQKRVAGLQDAIAQSHRARFNWLSVLSKSENVDNTMFMEAFKLLQKWDLDRFTGRYSMTWRQTAEIVLNRWTSQGLLRNGNAIIDTYKMKTIRSSRSYGWLLWTLERHGELSDERIQDLFDFLADIQEFSHIDAVLMQARMFNGQLSVNNLVDLVNNMASVHPEAAYDIYMQHCKGQVEPEACAPLIATMIYHGSDGIWAALDVPIYAAMPKWKRKAPSPKVLSQARIELIHEMATAFAHSEVHNPRQALRNVTQCWHFLRAHNVQPTSEISRAITQLGITADVKQGRWGRTERIKWGLEVIEKVEGAEIAHAVRKAVVEWREKLRARLAG